jgi:hypothetical protein
MSLTKCGKLSCNNFGNDFKCCGQCKAISYCSKECQVEDWKVHKKVCKTSISTNVFQLKDYLKSKGKFDKTRGEIICGWAIQYFRASGSNDTEQFVVVNVDMKKNTAEFSIDQMIIKETFTPEQRDILSEYKKKNLVIYVRDLNSFAMEIMMTGLVSKFDTKVFCIPIIDL